jgi:hypothetical protein
MKESILEQNILLKECHQIRFDIQKNLSTISVHLQKEDDSQDEDEIFLKKSFKESIDRLFKINNISILRM